MWDILKEIEWSDNGYKIALVVVIVVFVYALYHLVKFIGKRFMDIFQSLQDNVSELKELNKNAAMEITIIKQEQKFQNDQLIAHTERFKVTDRRLDTLMESLLQATKR